MTSTALVTTRHPLSAADRAAEDAFRAALAEQAAQPEPADPRPGYDAMIAQTPVAHGVGLARVDDGDAQGWWVRPDGAPRDRAILYLHGGGYGLGSAAAYRGLASQLAVRAGVAAFVLDYPLAPERPFPAAYDAGVAARAWIGRQGVAQVALAGDSAGAGLALATLARTVDDVPPTASVVVFSPWTDLAGTGASFNDPAQRDPIFQPARVTGLAAAYLAGADPADPRASPLYDVPRGLPPLLVQVGADERLLDDARRYAERASQRGGAVRLDVFEGLHHVFQLSVETLPPARRALDDAAAFVSRHWRG